MKNPTMTFADYYLPYHPERKCEIEPFLCLSSWRRPTKEEIKKSPDTCGGITILKIFPTTVNQIRIF